MWWHCLIMHITGGKIEKIEKRIVLDCNQRSLWGLSNWEKVILLSVHIYYYSTAYWYVADNAQTGIWKCLTILSLLWKRTECTLLTFWGHLDEKKSEIEHEKEGEIAWHVSVGVDGTNRWKSWSTHLLVVPGSIDFISL